MGHHRGRPLIGLCLLALLQSGCQTKVETRRLGPPMAMTVPLGLPRVVPGPQPTEASIAMGAMLYANAALSADGTKSCASCHNPEQGMTTRDALAIGVGGRVGKRNAPTVWNAAFLQSQFHDGRAATLEEQAAGPILSPMEMNADEATLLRRMESNAEIRQLYTAAFGGYAITLQGLCMAIADFERTQLRGNSAFDRFYFGRDETALSAEAKLGWEVFRDATRGNCIACHRVEAQSALFTDHLFHNLGVGMNSEGQLTDAGRAAVTKQPQDHGAFRTPTLRNIALTAPYMHDGSLRTLKEVVDFYVAGGNANEHRDPLMHPLTHLKREERAALVAFLESLTGEPTP
jgi:cytochrome c peroxidase